MDGAFRWAPGKRWVFTLAAQLLGVGAAWFVLGGSPAAPPPAAGQAVSAAPAASSAVLPGETAALPTAPPPAAADPAEATARVAQLWQRGPLRGTQLDGDWGRWVDGKLQPSRSLRLRFDYLLSGLGDVSVADLRQWIAQQVRADLGSAAVDPVLAVWDRYLTALQAATQIKRDPADAAAWQQASAQLGLLRRGALGADWAYAFYADEERADEAFLARHQLASSADDAGRAKAASADPATLLDPAAPGLSAEQRDARDAQRTATFGADATARLRTEEAAQAAWAQQLAAVRERLAAIAADPQLSALQRQQAREAEITRQYSGSALLRARALLGEAS